MKRFLSEKQQLFKSIYTNCQIVFSVVAFFCDKWNLKIFLALEGHFEGIDKYLRSDGSLQHKFMAELNFSMR